MVHIKKDRAGADSFGHVWDSDGDVVAVEDHHQAQELLRMGAGFTEVAAPEPKKPRRTNTAKANAEDTIGGD